MQEYLNIINDYEEFFKPISTIAGIITNYKQNTNIEQLQNEMNNIKSILQIDTIQLSDIELNIIYLFINNSISQYIPTDRVSIEIGTFYELLKYEKEDIFNGLEMLENYDFFNTDSYFNPEKKYIYNLKYDIFYRSNLVELLSKKSMTFIDITVLVINYLIKQYKHNESVKIEVMLNDLTLPTLLLNPILYRLNEYEAIIFSSIMPSKDNIVKDFIINKPILLKFKRVNNLKKL